MAGTGSSAVVAARARAGCKVLPARSTDPRAQRCLEKDRDAVCWDASGVGMMKESGGPSR